MQNDDKQAYQLAEQYWLEGNEDKAVRECRKLINYYRGGEAVEQAKSLLKKIANGEKPRIKQPDVKKPADKPVENKIVLPPEIEKEFDALIGMDSVKAQIQKFINIIKLNEKRGIPINNDMGYHFLLLGSPGTGKTTVARIIGRILHTLEIRSSETFIEVDKSDLVGQHFGETEENTKNIVAQAQGGTLFIDEAYTLYNKDSPRDFGREALNVLMKSMEDMRDTFTLILAGYKKEIFEMLEANVGLKSRLNYIIEIPDYSDDELVQIAEKLAEKKAFIITEPAKKAIKERINRERIDDKFGNARFTRNLINEAYSNLANRLIGTKHSYEDMFRLEPIDFGIDMQKTTEDQIAEAMQELKTLIGLDGVKNEVESIVNTIKVVEAMKSRGLETGGMGFGTLHMAFLGGAGTGKTTVARLIGKIYKALGVLKRGDVFIECSRKDLVGEYQGHTSPKTMQKINEAMGGILFIDEAYDLYGGENDSFGKEAITTLIAEMENNRDKLMVILAGYDDDINKLLDSNPGFRSRINTEVHFEDYSVEQLVDIFKVMARKDKLLFDSQVIEKIHNMIETKSIGKDFGNARGVRNILQTVTRNKNNRVAREMSAGVNLQETDFLTIKVEDVR